MIAGRRDFRADSRSCCLATPHQPVRRSGLRVGVRFGGYTLAEGGCKAATRRHADYSPESVPDLSQDHRRRQSGSCPLRQPPGNPGRRKCSITRTPTIATSPARSATDDKSKGRAAEVVSEKPPTPRPSWKSPAPPIRLEPGKISSPGERAVLERLQDRRQEARRPYRDIEMRESLLKAAEKRLDAKCLRAQGPGGARQYRDRQSRHKAEADRFKSIVAMYERT